MSKEKTLTINYCGTAVELALHINAYQNNACLYIGAVCATDSPEICCYRGSAFTDITVNLDHFGFGALASNEAFISANCPEELVKKLIALGICKDTGRKHVSGFCTYPLYVFDIDKLKEYEAE